MRRRLDEQARKERPEAQLGDLHLHVAAGGCDGLQSWPVVAASISSPNTLAGPATLRALSPRVVIRDRDTLQFVEQSR